MEEEGRQRKEKRSKGEEKRTSMAGSTRCGNGWFALELQCQRTGVGAWCRGWRRAGDRLQNGQVSWLCVFRDERKDIRSYQFGLLDQVLSAEPWALEAVEM
jgi:hypothetical protein